MDRRFVVGFFVGVLFIVILGGISSAYEDFQKQEQSKINMDAKIMSLRGQNDQQDMRIDNMAMELRELRRLFESKISSFSSSESKLDMLQANVDELRFRLSQ